MSLILEESKWEKMCVLVDRLGAASGARGEQRGQVQGHMGVPDGQGTKSQHQDVRGAAEVGVGGQIPHPLEPPGTRQKGEVKPTDPEGCRGLERRRRRQNLEGREAELSPVRSCNRRPGVAGSHHGGPESPGVGPPGPRGKAGVGLLILHLFREQLQLPLNGQQCPHQTPTWSVTVQGGHVPGGACANEDMGAILRTYRERYSY